MNLFFENDDQDVSRYGTQDLGLDCVLARAQKFLYSQVLFDPFEEKFDPPALLVQRGDSQCICSHKSPDQAPLPRPKIMHLSNLFSFTELLLSARVPAPCCVL